VVSNSASVHHATSRGVITPDLSTVVAVADPGSRTVSMSRVRRKSSQTSRVKEVIEKCVFFRSKIEDPDQLRKPLSLAIQ
jgi:hypothetical protein